MKDLIRKYLPVGSLIFGMVIFITTMPAFAAASASATRDITTLTLAPGDSTNVTIIITNDIDQALSLHENIPSGWSLTRVSDDASSYKSSTNEWVWFAVPAGGTKIVIYNLTVPGGAAGGDYTISGTISNASGVNDISGSGRIAVLSTASTVTSTATATTTGTSTATATTTGTSMATSTTTSIVTTGGGSSNINLPAYTSTGTAIRTATATATPVAEETEGQATTARVTETSEETAKPISAPAAKTPGFGAFITVFAISMLVFNIRNHKNRR